MAKIKKTMCDITNSDLKKWEKEIFKEIDSAKYLCKKCIRVSNTKDLLCKPQKIRTD